MNKSILSYVLSFSLLSFAFIQCGGSGTSSTSGSSSTPGVSALTDLPHATGPVVDSSGSSALKKVMKTATTGVNFNDADNDTFDDSSSIASCEMTNRFRQTISSAAQGDRILCYIQQVIADNPDLGLDIYDGNEHVLALTFSGEGDDGNGPSKVQLQIVKDSSGNITDFKMYSCEGDEQAEYLSQTIDADGNFNMLSKGVSSGGGDEDHSDQTTVTGTIAGGHFTGEKTISFSYNFVSGDSSHDGHGEGTVVQSSDSITFDGYETGSFSDDFGSGEYGNRVYSMAQLIDNNDLTSDVYDLRLLSLGDGAAHAFFTGSSDFGDWSDDVVEGWNGDTTAIDDDAAASYLAAVGDLAPIEASDSVDISFGEGETFDCSTEPEAHINIDDSSLQASCAGFQLGHDWVNCWELTGHGDS